MAKKIEMLNDQQEVVHPLTSSDCVIMENGKTLEEVMGDGIATPTVTHEGASFQVGVGDSNIEVVDGDVAGMTLEGQTYQNILPKPTTLIMETDEKEFKINDKIDNNIVLDDNIAEIATVKGQTYVNTVQEESASEYVAIDEELNGQSITTTGKPEGYVKNATLEGLTLVNTIQEPSREDSTVLELDADIDAQYATIDNTVQGGIHGATLKGQTLINHFDLSYWGEQEKMTLVSDGTAKRMVLGYPSTIKTNTKYLTIIPIYENTINNNFTIGGWNYYSSQPLITNTDGTGIIKKIATTIEDDSRFGGGLYLELWQENTSGQITFGKPMLIEYQEGMENWDIPYFEGMQSVEAPSVMTTGKNLFDGKLENGFLSDSAGQPNPSISHRYTPSFIKIDASKKYCLHAEADSFIGIVNAYYYDEYKNYLGFGRDIIVGVNTNISKLFTPHYRNASYIRFRFFKPNNVELSIDPKNIAFYESSTIIDVYEPYKSSTTKVGLLPILETEQGCYYSSSTGTRLTSNPNVNSVKYEVQGLSKVYVKVAHSNFSFWDSNDTYISGQSTIAGGGDNSEGYLDVPSNAVYMRCAVDNTKIAEVYEAVTLRKVGDAQDELDLETGKLTQRIGEVVLDGSENWTWYKETTNTIIVYTTNPLPNHLGAKYTNSQMVTNYLDVVGSMETDKDGCYISNTGKLNLAISKTKATSVNELKQYLQSTPLVVQYLQTESIKTVDLSIVDQDNNSLKTIQTHPTLTHITTSSNGLTPFVTIPSQLKYPTIIKPSTTYTVQLKQTTVNSEFPLTINLGGTVMAVPSTKFTITTPETLTSQDVIFTGKNNVIGEVVITEGDTTGIEYRYFEGMNDVKFSDSKFIARGKNLFNFENEGQINGLKFSNNGANNYIVSGTCTKDNTDFYVTHRDRNVTTFKRLNSLPIGTTITISKSSSVGRQVYFNITQKDGSPTKYPQTHTITNNDNVIHCFIRFMKGDTFDNAQLNLQIEIGSTATSYEPYKGVTIEQSIDSIPLTSDMFEQGGFKNENNIKGMSLQQYPLNVTTTRLRAKTLIKVKPNTRYLLKNKPDTLYKGWCLTFDKNGDYTGLNIDNLTDFITNYDVHYIAPVLNYEDDSDITPSTLDSLNLTLQEVTDEIVLRSLPSGVCDTLNLVTGEYVQRVGEIVLDGSERWYEYRKTYHGANKSTFQAYCTRDIAKTKLNDPINCDKLVQGDLGFDGNVDVSKYPCNYIHNYTDGTYTINRFFVSVNKEMFGLDSNADYDTCLTRFGKWLQSNPIKIQYRLATPIITKVNLTNMTKLPSYNTTTHYDTIVPSNSLVPNIKIPSTIDYNVAIKPSTKYTVRCNTTDTLSVDLGGSAGTLSNGKVTLTTPSTLAHNSLKLGNGKAKEVMVIEGSEIKDNVPFFNGMKNVQMGGIKLVNIARGGVPNTLVSSNANGTQYTYTSNGSTSWGNVGFDMSLLKTDTIYTVYMEIVSNTSDNGIKVQLAHGNVGYLNISAKTTGVIKQTVKTAPSFLENNYFALYFRNSSTSGQQVVVKNFMIIEGDWTHLDEIPFIENEMIIEQPIIRSQGKNLFDGKLESGRYAQNQGVPFPDNTAVRTVNKIKVKPSTVYTLKIEDGTSLYNTSEYCNGVYIGFKTASNSLTFTTSPTTNELHLSFKTDNINLQFQLEEGSTATTYEPFKQHTLSSNRVIGYEEDCYYAVNGGVKTTQNAINSMLADVEGLSIAYVTGGSSNYTFWDKDNVYISSKQYLDTSLSSYDKNGFITVPSNAKYMRFAAGGETNAQPLYKVATVTGELLLRSLPSGVCDSFNLVTGEYVQRVGEVLWNGKEDWMVHATWSEGSILCLHKPMDGRKIQSYAVCDRFKTATFSQLSQNNIAIAEGLRYESGSSSLYVFISKDRLMSHDVNGFKQYLSQNPITVQYELETPIVRKIGLTAKGTYRETKLNGSENWISANADANNTICTRYYLPNGTSVNSVAPNMIVNSPTFSDYIKSRKYPSDSHGQYEYVSVINEGLYLQIYKNKLLQDSVSGFKQWLSQHPVKVGYLTNQSNTTYSNIHKPIFFNNANVQYLPNNVDIQPTLTLQSRSRNSYVMDMMKANTKYTLKALTNANSFTIDGTSYGVGTNGSFTSPSTLTNKLLITGLDTQELMIIEGDVTGKELPYYKGIRSSFDNTDEIEVLSTGKNLADVTTVYTNMNSGYNDRHWTIVQKDENGFIAKVKNYSSTGTHRGFPASLKVYVEPNTTYYLSYDTKDNGVAINSHAYVYSNCETWGGSLIKQHGEAQNGFTFTTHSDTEYIVIGLGYALLENNKEIEVSNLILSRSETTYEPYKSNGTKINMPTQLETVEVVRPIMEVGGILVGDGTNYEDTGSRRTKDYIPVEPNMKLTFMNGNAYRAENVYLYGINKNYIGSKYTRGSGDLTIPNNCYFIRFYSSSANTSDISVVKQQYKPIALNSLPNGVKDEIVIDPVSNKAKLIQRVGKVVLDGFSGGHDETNVGHNFRKFVIYTGLTSIKVAGQCVASNNLPCIVSGDVRNTIRLAVDGKIVVNIEGFSDINEYFNYLHQSPITVYYELAAPIIHEIRLTGFPFVYEDGSVQLNTELPHKTLVDYNVNQEHLINGQNETIIRHDKQIDNLYDYIELYLEEEYRMELFRMQLELSL